MNKHLASAAVIVSLLALLGGCNEEQPQKPAPQFGVVQLSKLYQDSNLGKAGMERLNDLQNKAMGTLKGLQDELEKARAAKDEAAAGKLEKDLQAHVYFLQNVVKQDQEHVSNVVQTELTKAFDKYREEHGLLGVFPSEALVSVSPAADITAAIQTLVDQAKPDFGPLPSLEMPPLPEPANAEPAETPQETPLKEEPAPAAPETSAPAK
ncbi:OmpH family outer membrane protein [uncultured Mailhella sp.]|uniref:OmpH family outer membrane protein n=1 Tax=uncultured Mailhella sp. TaxID=1981031 RepID=UPI0026308CAE|nr:OmpH family outer membrane protein [uncultured Mailhella sp.]